MTSRKRRGGEQEDRDEEDEGRGEGRRERSSSDTACPREGLRAPPPRASLAGGSRTKTSRVDENLKTSPSAQLSRTKELKKTQD